MKITFKAPPPPKKKVFDFWSLYASPQTCVSAFSVNFFLYYETMSNCSQNCWINFDCCFKRLFHIGVWTFARFVKPLLVTIICVWEIWSGSNNRVYMYHVFHWLAKKNIYIYILPKSKKHITAPIFNQKLKTLFWGLKYFLNGIFAYSPYFFPFTYSQTLL